MPIYNISKTLNKQRYTSEKTMSVIKMFGLTTDKINKANFAINCQLEINDGDIVYITGPSGAGKSILLKELEKIVPSNSININKIELPANKSVIDCIDGDFMQGLKILSISGLNDVFCILNQPMNLSNGQKFQLLLAMAIALDTRFIFADNFCDGLDRIAASVISYNIHKYAKRTNTIFILASSHDDILTDLLPDVLVVRELSGAIQVVRPYIEVRTRKNEQLKIDKWNRSSENED